MAYYGGVNQERPWPRVNIQVIIIAALAIMLFAIIGMQLIASGDSQEESGGFFARLFGTDRSKEAAAPVVRAAYIHDVLVPIESIKPGKKLTSTMFNVEARDVRGVERKVVHDMSEVENLYSTVLIVAGMPVMLDQVSSVAPVNAITASIPEGYRAVAIPINAETGVEGWVRPGAKVDVVWISQHRGRPLVSTIVENAEVLSAERSVERNPNPNAAGKPVPSHVTLLLSVKDAQKIQLAKTTGSLSLSLRGDEDTNQVSGTGTMTIDKLLRRTDMEAMDEVQGKVQFDGQEYNLRGGSLVVAKKDVEEAQPVNKGK